MTKQKKVQKQTKKTETTVDMQQEFLVLGHLIKYNVYMLCKSVVFSALSKSLTVDEAVAATHRVMSELDLDFKRRSDQTQNEETLQ